MSELLTYEDVPTDQQGNLLWRVFLWYAVRDPKFRALVVQSCAADKLFYINSFIWVQNSRKSPSCVPFITYSYQTEYIRKLCGKIDDSRKPENQHLRFDLGVVKSRQIGLTESTLAALDSYWRFDKDTSFRCISAKEERVDNSKDMSALFQRLDFMEERLPSALQVRGAKHDRTTGRTHLNIYNPKRRVSIIGESSNPNAGRGGINLAVIRDEEAAAEYGFEISSALNMTTKCQIRISTPAGVGNSFHAAYTNRVKGGIEFMEIHWSEHPEYAAGLYSNKGGKIEIIDQQWHDEHPEYKCRMDETYSDPGARWEFLRSPWFDSQCDASDSTHQIAQELQLSFLGSGSPFFSPEKLSSVAADCILDPMHVGTLTQWVRKVKFYDSDPRSNRCKLWFDPVSGRPLQNTTYTIGIDVSAGTGASDSCISVADDTASEKVFEWVSNGVTPEQLAVVADAVGDWFTTEKGKPYIAWDAGGPGAAFGIVLMRLGSHHVYYHTPSGVVNAKRASKPGVPSQASLKQELMETYRAALFSGSFITRSRAAFEQCEQFKYSEGGQRIVHQKSVNSRDSSGRGEQHGDIASSEAVLVLAMRDRPAPRRSAVVVRQGCPQWFKDNLRREKSRASSSFVGHAFYG